MMQFTTQSGRYFVTSYGNGWAYEVTDQASGKSLWFQDDDADQFRQNTNDLENESEIRQYFDCLLG